MPCLTSLSPPASSASHSASDDDVARQREHFTADTALGAGSASSLPLDQQASAALTEPRLARLTRRLGSDERASRRSPWIGRVGAFMATALVVTLISYLLVDWPQRARTRATPRRARRHSRRWRPRRPPRPRPTPRQWCLMPPSRRPDWALEECNQRLDLPSSPSRPRRSTSHRSGFQGLA